MPPKPKPTENVRSIMSFFKPRNDAAPPSLPISPPAHENYSVSASAPGPPRTSPINNSGPTSTSSVVITPRSDVDPADPSPSSVSVIPSSTSSVSNVPDAAQLSPVVASDHSFLDSSFSHRGPDGTWDEYPKAHCAIIATSMAAQPSGGRVHLPAGPFEVRWGSEATSERMRKIPSEGIIQVCRPNVAMNIVLICEHSLTLPLS